MEWRDEGVILSTRKFGESSLIVEALTRDHGRAAGLARGGARTAATLQPGTQAAFTWRARLEENLGAFRIEPTRSRLAAAMADREALLILTAFCALCRQILPERLPAPTFYDRSLALLDRLDVPERRALYARWEVALLAEAGAALDLSRCAATGATQDLRYVSPKSGRAVSAEAGAPWADRLLPLPRCLIDEDAPCPPADFAAALRMTGFFLERWALPALDLRAPPEARRMLLAYISR